MPLKNIKDLFNSCVWWLAFRHTSLHDEKWNKTSLPAYVLAYVKTELLYSLCSERRWRVAKYFPL